MWQLQDGKLYKSFKFSDFRGAFDFMTKVAILAEQMNHHPVWLNDYDKVEIWLKTHSEDSVTDKDHELAKAIDALSVDNFSGDPEDILHDTVAENTTENTGIRVDKINGPVKLFTDGGSRGNPGKSAIGMAIFDMNNVLIKKESKYIGITTNNQAEYQALKSGLEICLKMGVPEVHVHMDSLLVVNQLKGIYKVKNADLQPVYQTVKELVVKFQKVTFTHVPRELNKVADGMVNECLDSL